MIAQRKFGFIFLGVVTFLQFWISLQLDSSPHLLLAAIGWLFLWSFIKDEMRQRNFAAEEK